MIQPQIHLWSLLLLLLVSTSSLEGQAAVEVQVTPAQLRLRAGQSERLFLSAYDGQGNLLADPVFTFTLSRTGVVRVGQDGTVVALAPGSVQVEVRSGTGVASVAVSVATPPPPPKPEPVPVLPAGAYLVPTPDTLLLLRLETGIVRMALQTTSGSGLGQVNVSWRSSAPEIVSVDGSGAVQALQVGSARLLATGLGGLTGSVWVDVREDSLTVVPAQMALPVGGADSIGVRVPAQGSRPVTYGLAWRSSDPAVARVTPDGVVYGSGPGEALVTVIGYGQQRSVRVNVHPPVSRLRFAPAPGTPIRLTLGGSAPIMMQALAADSTPLTQVAYEFHVSDTSVAVFDESATRIVARGVGRTTLTLSTWGFEPTTWEIEVAAGGLAIDRPRRRLAPNARDSLVVSRLGAEGAEIGRATDLDYSTNRREVATIDQRGGIVTGAVGAATITARTPWGATATADLFVTEALLVGVRRGAGVELVQLDTSGARSLVPVLSVGEENFDGAWSPDGTRIAFAATVGGNTDIYVADADGGNVLRLTDAPEAETGPAWSPDGGTIVFTSLRSGTAQVWAMNEDGTARRALTSGPGENAAPAFRPDGRLIAFISTRDGNPDLFEMGNEGGDPRAITRTPEPESHPAYVANGDLVVVVNRGGYTDLLRIRAGDGRRTMLQSMAGQITALAVAADGTALVYGLTEPGAAPSAPPVHSLRRKPLAPDQPPVVIPLQGEVRSVSLQVAR